MVAGSPRAVRRFMQLGSAVLSTALDSRRREIAVLRGRTRTRAPDEWAQHEQLARAVGVTDAEIDALATEEPVASLDEECNLICRVADDVTRRRAALRRGARADHRTGNGPRERQG